MFPLLQCLLKWSYLKGSGTLLRIAEGIKKHTLEGWVGLPIAKLLERNKVKRLSLFGSFLQGKVTRVQEKIGPENR